MIRSALKPKKDPIKVRGVAKNSQRDSRATRVPNGTAAEEPLLQSIKLVMKKMPKRMPGTKKAVRRILVFQARPSMAEIRKH